ncbi:hypothetical protein ACIBJI_41930 [Nocardia sp. NPDC050408]|uniref:hypothetical protein n=1 Tax=Nocardia sp. NPDC050408 TaxID=3364319 RepID=UPI00378F42AE
MTTELSLDPAVTRAILDGFLESPAAREAQKEMFRTISEVVVPDVFTPALTYFGSEFPSVTSLNVGGFALPDHGAEAIGAALKRVSTIVPTIRLPGIVQVAGSPELIANMREVFEAVIKHRRLKANWWLHITPIRPFQIRGLEEALPGRRRSVDKIIHAQKQLRALLRHRHRHVPDTPGRLITARCRVPRGPNFRRLTSPRQPAGLVVRA